MQKIKQQTSDVRSYKIYSCGWSCFSLHYIFSQI